MAVQQTVSNDQAPQANPARNNSFQGTNVVKITLVALAAIGALVSLYFNPNLLGILLSGSFTGSFIYLMAKPTKEEEKRLLPASDSQIV